MVTWTRQEVFHFLAEEPRVAHLATVDSSGNPHVVPVWFSIADERLVIHAMGSSKKVRNLRNRTRFALSVDTDVWPYRGVVLRGSADLRAADGPGLTRFVEATTVAYLGEEMRPLGTAMAAMAGEHLLIELTPESWSAIDYSR